MPHNKLSVKNENIDEGKTRYYTEKHTFDFGNEDNEQSKYYDKKTSHDRMDVKQAYFLLCESCIAQFDKPFMHNR